MKKTIRGLVAGAMLLVSTQAVQAADLTREHFTVRNTADLLKVCEAQESDPLYQAAIGFCHGFMVGAYRFYQATIGADPDAHLFCLPTPEPSREQLISAWKLWVKADSARQDVPAVESPFRFLAATYPCNPSAADKGASR